MAIPKEFYLINKKKIIIKISTKFHNFLEIRCNFYRKLLVPNVYYLLLLSTNESK